MVMLKRLIIIILIIAATVVYALYQKNQLTSQLVPGNKSESILGKLPATSFTSLEGKAVGLHELYKNEDISLLVVHFWGTWCGPCEAELPELLSLIKRFEGQAGVKFLLVAVNDDVSKVKKHIKGLGATSGTWLIDNENAHRDLFGTTRVPETFVFSSGMSTLRKYVGPQDWNKAAFFQTFDEFIEMSTHKL